MFRNILQHVTGMVSMFANASRNRLDRKGTTYRRGIHEETDDTEEIARTGGEKGLGGCCFLIWSECYIRSSMRGPYSVKIRVWVGPRGCRQRTVGGAISQKGTRFMQQYIGQRIAKGRNRRTPSITASHEGQGRSSRGQPDGDNHPFPVHHATEQVAYPLHPAIFVAQ